MFSISLNGAQLTAALSDIEQRQLPFAVSNAINDTALDFQEAERRHFADVFTIRRQDFIFKQGVKMLEFSTKSTLRATIGTDPKADFLAKFETGGEKTPIGGHSLAVPVDIRQDVTEVIPTSDRPRQLLSNPSSNVFIVEIGDERSGLPPGIYRRVDKRVELLYALTPKAEIEAVLEYGEIAEHTVAENFPEHFQVEFARAMATAR